MNIDDIELFIFDFDKIMRKNNINISSDWAEKLSQEFTKPYFVRLISYISEEEENFNKVETNYPVDDYISEILPSFGFVLGGIVMGLTFRYIVN